MFRLASGATLVAALVLGGLSGTAMAAQAPPALGGETLSASASSLTSPYPFLLPCGGSSQGPAFNFSGTATGPYPGSFVETGSVEYPYIPTPGTVDVSLGSYAATFTINSPNATVTGTETMSGPALAVCATSPGGEGLDIGPVPTSYRATIMTASGTYTVQGTSTTTLGQGLGNLQGNWGAGLVDGPFVTQGRPHHRHCRRTAQQSAPPGCMPSRATQSSPNIPGSDDTRP